MKNPFECPRCGKTKVTIAPENSLKCLSCGKMFWRVRSAEKAYIKFMENTHESEARPAQAQEGDEG